MYDLAQDPNRRIGKLLVLTAYLAPHYIIEVLGSLPFQLFTHTLCADLMLTVHLEGKLWEFECLIAYLTRATFH